MYSIGSILEAPSGINLCIQPKRGIVMQGQIKKIKVWVANQDREQVLGMNMVGKSLRINTTMKAEYNKKVMEKLKINGWQSIKNSYQTFQIPIMVSNKVEYIRSSLKSSHSSLNKNSMSRQLPISQKLKNNRNEFNVGQSYSLTKPLKIDNQKMSDKLDKQLDFLFKNQVSRIVNKNQNEGRLPENLRFGQGEMVSYGSNPNIHKFGKGQPVQYGSIIKNNHNFGSSTPQIVTYTNKKTNQSVDENNQYLKQQNNQRFLQVIMLAALAGFFAALGSNFKNLFT